MRKWCQNSGYSIFKIPQSNPENEFAPFLFITIVHFHLIREVEWKMKICICSKRVHIVKQESPPAWTQEAYRSPLIKYSICCSVPEGGTPSQVQIQTRGWYPIPGPGPDGGDYPIPGPDGGVPHPRSRQGGNPSLVQTRGGGTPSQVQMGVTPSLVGGYPGVPPSRPGQVPLSRSRWGDPIPGWGTPRLDLIGVPPIQSGLARVAPLCLDLAGVPPPPPGVDKLTKWNYYLPLILRMRAVITTSRTSERFRHFSRSLSNYWALKKTKQEFLGRFVMNEQCERWSCALWDQSSVLSRCYWPSSGTSVLA